MSDTMRAAARLEASALYEIEDTYNYPEEALALAFERGAAWQAAQSQPAPPVPASVQEIMRLMMPYISACEAYAAVPDKLLDGGAADNVAAAFKPLEAALTTLVEENHRLKFELDGVRAMRGPVIEEHAARWMWARKNLLSACFQSGRHNSASAAYSPINEANTDWYWDKVADNLRGIAPEQGENHG